MPRGTLLALLLVPAAAATAAAAQAQTAAVSTDRPGAIGGVAAGGRAAAVAPLRLDWALDPAIRDFVGPAEYVWDFNAPSGGQPGATPTPDAGGYGGGEATRMALALPAPGPAVWR